MAETENASPQPLVTELNVSANIMAMEPGLYCVFHADNAAINPQSGLPGVRITAPPGGADPELEIRTFGEGGWLAGAAALVQTPNAASVLVTVYRDATSPAQGPQLQVVRLGDVPPKPAAAEVSATRVAPAATPRMAPAEAPIQPAAAPVEEEPRVARDDAEMAAHIQRRGDVLARLGDWMGKPGSQQWIEGFALAPRGEIGLRDIEYQAVLGRGWLSPWADGGQFCGSRGMALPILGLRVRLKGAAAETHKVLLEATFTDGTNVGPSEDGPLEAPSLAPLEAFRVNVVPVASASPQPATAQPATAQPAGASRAAGSARGPGRPRKAVTAEPVTKQALAKAQPAKPQRATRAAPTAKPAAKAKPVNVRASAGRPIGKAKAATKGGTRRRS